MHKPQAVSKSKKGSINTGSEVLQALFENGKSELSIHFLRWKIWRKWPEFVGPTIADCSEPVAYHRGVLYLWVKNSAWMQQLVFMREHIKDNINKKLQQEYVKDIKLTMDRRAVPSDPAASQELKDSLAQLVKDYEE